MHPPRAQPRNMANSRTLPVALILLSAVIAGTVVAAADDKGKGRLDPASTNYVVLDQNPSTGQERFFCLARGRCRFHIIECPAECPHRKPKKNRRVKGCFADCSSRCETTCKHRMPNCNGFGSICYDPRFVGGDGSMFYFHGAKDADFALVSDRNLHINAHFIGFRPAGRSRDFTWVQAVAVMFDSHALVVAARQVAAWDDAVDVLDIIYDGKAVTIPTDSDVEWRASDGVAELVREVAVERTAEANSVRLMVSGIVEMDLKAVAIGAEENRTHGYGLPAGDAFAHLEMQFKFEKLSDEVEGILGQTYRPGYVSPAKKGVPMPVLGGEDRYRTQGFMSPHCGSCRFRPAKTITDKAAAGEVAGY